MVSLATSTIILLLVWLPSHVDASSRTPAEVVGPARCVRCHAREMAWWLKEDGPPPRGHVNALMQLASPEGRRYAARVGVDDVYDPKGGCVACHATVFNGEAQEGVSCESCHGAASAYLTVHAQPGAYRVSVAAGLRDVRGQVKVWGARCLECHRITDATLLAAGHSSGTSFDLGQKFQVVARHWTRTYSAAAVSAAGRELTAAMRAPHR